MMLSPAAHRPAARPGGNSCAAIVPPCRMNARNKFAVRRNLGIVPKTGKMPMSPALERWHSLP